MMCACACECVAGEGGRQRERMVPTLIRILPSHLHHCRVHHATDIFMTNVFTRVAMEINVGPRSRDLNCVTSVYSRELAIQYSAQFPLSTRQYRLPCVPDLCTHTSGVDSSFIYPTRLPLLGTTPTLKWGVEER